MKPTKHILLYGNSLILESIRIGLGLYSQFEVSTLASPLQETQKFDAAKTDTILFDIGNTCPEVVFSLLEINPALQLIGVSSDVNLVRVWSIREMREVSMRDLLQVITSEAKDSAVESSGCEVQANRSK